MVPSCHRCSLTYPDELEQLRHKAVSEILSQIEKKHVIPNWDVKNCNDPLDFEKFLPIPEDAKMDDVARKSWIKDLTKKSQDFFSVQSKSDIL